KLGIDISQATVAKYMVRRRNPPSQTWRTFLDNHVTQLMAADFFVVPTATCRLLFVLVIIAHDRRRVVHTAVSAILIRDRDLAFQAVTATVKAMGIEEVLTARPKARRDRHGGSASGEYVLKRCRWHF